MPGTRKQDGAFRSILRLLSLAVVLVVLGCTATPRGETLSDLAPSGKKDALAEGADSSNSVSGQLDSESVSRTAAGNPKSGPSRNRDAARASRLAAAPAAAKGNVNAEELAEIVRDIQALRLDQAQTDRLIADLRQTDPTLWPQLVTTLKASVAYRKKRQMGGKSHAQSRDRSPDAIAADKEASPSQPRPSGQPSAAASEEKIAAAPFGDEPELLTALAQADQEEQDAIFDDAAVPPKHVATARARKSKTKSARPSALRGATAVEAAGDQQSIAEQKVGGDESRAEVIQAAALGPARQTPAPIKFEQPRISVTTDWQQQLASTIEMLEAQAQAQPGSSDATQQLCLRLLYVLSQRREDALRPIPGMSPAKQDFWNKELYGLAALLRGDDNAGESAGEDGKSRPAVEAAIADAALHLADASSRLRDFAPLSIRNLTFCTEVASYGVYKPFDKYEFHPGQEVLLYAEVENFKSELVPEGYKTVLCSRYHMFDKEGKQVDERDFGVTEEVCRNRRRDFFIRYQFALPSRIYDGAYTLKLTVEDSQGEKVGQSAIDLKIKEAKAH